ncbi:glutamine-hydrolyzing carbamoyl-phosphate synthase small subunit [Gammaproteobacteria bacterium]|nr:glutamine-hydrolyzing carbamoyl-phosphate synthase small subunit [Gammaproteobacteria bacterium]
MTTPAYLVLEDGTVYTGTSVGSHGSTEGEVVFNTSITGYQEILTDPSYRKQIVTLTYPHIGNVGVTTEDCESTQVHAAGLVIRDLPQLHSSWRAEQSLEDYLKANHIVAIADIDTRSLTRRLREKGALNGVIATGDVDLDALLQQAKGFSGLKGMDLAQEVTTDSSYAWDQASWSLEASNAAVEPKAAVEKKFKVVALDFGVKHNILRILVDLGCELQIVPAKTSYAEIAAMAPDGVFLSNGPGDPEPCDYAITLIRQLIENKVPSFGICLGHQLFALAAGAKTVKMKFGHHGANHPVKDIETGQVMISSQNHGFAVDEESLPDCLVATHRSLFDGSLQGIRHLDAPAYGFQGHPEASPGPHDVRGLFVPFIQAMSSRSNSKN